ncbi:hypothetical protein K3495_g8984 [Podosphaera aphanis]|nr:hypothetical protein K3495_g8984 [Podosphaera aphanis]
MSKSVKDETEVAKMEDEMHVGLNMSGLILPSSMKLEGAENYLQWKQVMLRNIIAAGLIKYLQTDIPKPPIDMSNWQSIAPSELDKVSE